MREISIGFSTRKKWALGSWLIRKVEKTEFSHTFISWKDEEIDRRKIFEAIGSGVRLIGNVVFKQKAKVIDLYDFEVPEEVFFWIEQYTHDQSGKPFGYKHIYGLFVMRIFGAFGVKIKNPYKDGDYSQICVESGAYIIEKGLKVDLPGDIEDYGLREYFDFVSKYGNKVPKEKIEEINARSK